MRSLVSLSALLALSCAAAPNGIAKAQDAAQELNVNARFGRMEMAIERVAPQARDEFIAHRKGWGGKLRIADIEMAGLRPKGESAIEVNVRVAWYRIEDQELRVTTLHQDWQDVNGEWKLVGEQRADGEIGLIGEQVVVDAPTTPRARAQFPTIRIGASDPDSE
jgi:hypothetical protein